MRPDRTPRDPDGHYSRLGVAPTAEAETITTAYRRKARLVHPDVPVTGDADAFVALKRAYDILIHPGRRAAYDRSAAAPPREDDAEYEEIGPVPFPDVAGPPTRHPRLTDLPTPVWAGMAVILAVGVIEVGLHLRTPPSLARHEPIPALAREVPPPSTDEPMRLVYGQAPVRLAGTPNFYILPASGGAMLWRSDDAKHSLLPWGQLPPFSAVQVVRLAKSSGMVEVRVTDNANGFIEAARLAPGDTAAAARAWCTFHAGPPPANGEILSRDGDGKATFSIGNRSGQPAVVKLRATDGAVIASVFLSPGAEATVNGLPEQAARVEFATGEVWSRACHGFAAGMRAQLLTDPVAIGTMPGIAIPPDRAIAVTELSDQAFERQ